jgi:hypothetical protein
MRGKTKSGFCLRVCMEDAVEAARADIAVSVPGVGRHFEEARLHESPPTIKEELWKSGPK